MSSNRHPITVFILVLILVLGLVFFIHVQLLQWQGLPSFGDQIIPSYLINMGLAAGIFVGIYLLRIRLKNSIGFLFMAGSLLKFGVFFLAFYPSYNHDGLMERAEFAAFFVPYAFCLVVETVFTARLLQRMP